MSDWNQPLCDVCWQRRWGHRRPFRMKHPDEEICCDCGRGTCSGIYMRLDPATVRYPAIEETPPL